MYIPENGGKAEQGVAGFQEVWYFGSSLSTLPKNTFEMAALPISGDSEFLCQTSGPEL